MKSLFFLAIFISAALISSGQTFAYRSINPYGIEIINQDGEKLAFSYMFADMDRDGDYDLLLAGLDSIDVSALDDPSTLTFFLDIQENIGNKENPSFGPRTAFADFTFPTGFFLPAVGDLNNDGWMDLVVSFEADSSFNQHLLYYRNLGNNRFEKIDLVAMELEPTIPASLFFPHLLDLDNDGDLDILLSGYQPSVTVQDSQENLLLYAKNIGDLETPQFLGWFNEPYGLEPDIANTLYDEGDIDDDGDIDLLKVSLGDDYASISFLENIPDQNAKPRFTNELISPFGLPEAEEQVGYISPVLVDIDADGDLDFFVFKLIDINDTTGSGVLFYENTAISTDIKDEFYIKSELVIFPNPTSDHISILKLGEDTIEKIWIYSIDGKLVREISKGFYQPISVKELSRGTYILKFQMSQGSMVKHLVLTK